MKEKIRKQGEEGGKGIPNRCSCGYTPFINPCPACCTWWDSRCNKLYPKTTSKCPTCGMLRIKSDKCP
jgi:hypothetical protein